MRRKKHKETKKALQFYRINFGFRPPFKVLLDGNFVHALEALKRGDATQQIEHLLGDKARLFTTRCVMQELRRLGSDFTATRKVCKGYALHKCGHEEAAAAAECLAAQVEGGNPEHFFVATQDRALQRRVMATPGGAVAFVSVSGVHLDTPSELQKRHVKKEKMEHMAPGKVERSSTALSELAQAEEGRPSERAVFKRAKAKGPNPLAVKPKQKSSGSGPAQAAPDGAGGAQQHKRSRQRRKREAEGQAGGT